MQAQPGVSRVEFHMGVLARLFDNLEPESIAIKRNHAIEVAHK
jgi:hypothetical protein